MLRKAYSKSTHTQIPGIHLWVCLSTRNCAASNGKPAAASGRQLPEVAPLGGSGRMNCAKKSRYIRLSSRVESIHLEPKWDMAARTGYFMLLLDHVAFNEKRHQQRDRVATCCHSGPSLSLSVTSLESVLS